MMQKALSGSPTVPAGKSMSGNSALMHRIVGNTGGAPVLARLVPTHTAQKGAANASNGSPQQLTHLQLAGHSMFWVVFSTAALRFCYRLCKVAHYNITTHDFNVC